MEVEENIFQESGRLLREEQKQVIIDNAQLISSFKTLCSKKGIELTDENFDYHYTIGIVATHPGILFALYPDIIPDKEGLLSLNFLRSRFSSNPFSHGCFYDTNCIVLVHPYFRRNYYAFSNYAPRFIEKFWNLNNPKIEPLIALDTNRVRINVDNSAYRELDTWFGPKFKKDIISIPDGHVKLRPPLDLIEQDIGFFFADNFSLQINWKERNGFKVFEAEEYKSESLTIYRNGNLFYPVRYVHAEFDISTGAFSHFDGAIHFYSEDEYLKKKDADMNYDSKNTAQIKAPSEKLFKMNGTISIETWMEFVAHFFSGNPLILEYFDGVLPPHILDIVEKLRSLRNK